MEEAEAICGPVHTTTVATTGAVDNTAENEEKSNFRENQDNHLDHPLSKAVSQGYPCSESDSPVGHLPDRRRQGLACQR